jgi:hypothetical protein
MTDEELDRIVRHVYAQAFADGIAVGKRLANGKPPIPKKAGRPRKGTLTNEEFLDRLAQGCSAMAAE